MAGDVLGVWLKAVQGKEVGRDATEGGVRAEVVIVVTALSRIALTNVHDVRETP